MLTVNHHLLSFDFGDIRSGTLCPRASIFYDKEGAATTLDANGAVFLGEEMRYTFLGTARTQMYACDFDRCRLNWHVSYAERDGVRAVFCRAGITNTGSGDLYLANIGLSSVEGERVVCDGDAADWYLGWRASLDEKTKCSYEKMAELYQSWGWEVPPMPDDPRQIDGRYRGFGEFLPLFARGRENGLFIAPVGTPVAFLSEECFVEHGGERHGQFSLSVWAEMSCVRVAPGQTRWGQQIAFVYGTFAGAVGGVMHHLAETHGSRVGRPPVVGWCSWYDLYSQITDESVMSTAKAWTTLKDHCPVNAIQVDDGYQVTTGDWARNEKFPGDWTPFLETVKSAGAMPGIWLAPVSIHESTQTYADHPDWIVRDKDGNPTNGMNNWGPTAYWLDVTHPDAFAFAVDVVKQKRQEGFTYFKIDFNIITVDGRRSYDAGRTQFEVMRDLYAAYRDAIGEDSYLCACAGMTRSTFGYSDANRIGADSPPRWDTRPDACCLRCCMMDVAQNFIAGDIIFANDPDVTYLFPKFYDPYPTLTDAEYQTWHSTVGLFGGMQMISDAMATKRAQENVEMLSMLAPPAKEKAVPLHPATDPDLHYLGFSAIRPWGDFAVEMVFNPEEEMRGCTVELGDKNGVPCHVWSFWDKHYFGVHDADFALDVDRHGCRVLRLTPVREDIPCQMIGSDLHISIGAAEIIGIRTVNSTTEVTLNPAAGKRNGSLYFHAAVPPAEVTAVGVGAVSHTWQEGVLCVTLSDRALDGTQKIRIR